MHDTGWASSDAQQIQRLRSGGPHAGTAVPVSFIAISPREVEEAWTASIDTVEGFSRTGAMVVSRHFSLIAQHDQAHQRFLQAEKSRQKQAQRASKRRGYRKVDSSAGVLRPGVALLVERVRQGSRASSRASGLAPGKNRTSGEDAERRQKPPLRAAGRSHRPFNVDPGAESPVPAQGPRAETLTWHVE